jgi:hypothetical protein
MAVEESREAIALRDSSGGWYLLTIEVLVAAVATPEQQAALDHRFQEAASGLLGAGGARAWSPLRVMGVVSLPLPGPRRACLD